MKRIHLFCLVLVLLLAGPFRTDLVVQGETVLMVRTVEIIVPSVE